MNDKLLFHIAYYMTNKKRLDNKNSINKASSEFNNHVFKGVCLFLKEINEYKGFSIKKVVLDVNEENSFLSKIDPSLYPSITLEINSYSFAEEHPFRLTTKHRLSMRHEIEDFDWFGYSEDDTIITKSSMEYIHNNLDQFYKKENKVFTIPRMVYNKKKEYFYSDIIKPSSPVFNKNYIIPTNRFGACWVYSKTIMKDWIKSKSFLNFNHVNKDGGIRVKMGTGFLEKSAVIPIYKEKKQPCIECIHLGYCGEYYFKHPRGYHTLPKLKLF